MDTATRRTFLKRSAGIGLAAIGGSYLRIGHTADDHIYVTSSGRLVPGERAQAHGRALREAVRGEGDPGAGQPTRPTRSRSCRAAARPYDVAAFGGNDMYRLIRAKKLAQVDEKSVPSLADVPEKFKADWEGCGSLYDYSSVGIAYRPDKIQGGVKSWKEFVERTVAGEFGKQVFFNNLSSNVRGAEVLSMFGKIYGSGYGDIEASIATLERMKPHIFKFFTAFNDPVVLLTSGEGAIGPGWDGRTFIAEDSTKGMVKWVDPTEGAVSSGPVMAVVKGGKGGPGQGLHELRPGRGGAEGILRGHVLRRGEPQGAIQRKAQASPAQHRLRPARRHRTADQEHERAAGPVEQAHRQLTPA